MRIVGGRFRGHRLAGPDDGRIRPTSDRARETLFNILAHGRAGHPLEGAMVLDLFAGTGALGLEALSRGARFCLFVEDDAAARGLIRENIEALGLTGASKIFRRDAADLGEVGKMGPFDLVLLDPPYGRGLGEKALASVLAGGWLATEARLVLEERHDVEVLLPEGLVLLDRRSAGEAQFLFLARAADGASTP